jgi:hypothetical protein
MKGAQLQSIRFNWPENAWSLLRKPPPKELKETTKELSKIRMTKSSENA